MFRRSSESALWRKVLFITPAECARLQYMRSCSLQQSLKLYPNHESGEFEHPSSTKSGYVLDNLARAFWESGVTLLRQQSVDPALERGE